MKKTVRTLIPLFLLLFCFSCHITAQTKKGYDITISLKEKATKEPIIMATCVLNPLGAYAATDMDGKAVIKNIPEGNYQLEVTYVGFETLKTSLVVKKNLHLDLSMQETSLALKEVTVVARQNVSGTSTSSVIGRQAIDHLQASSLADVMQLMPGALMGNADLTSQQNIQIRQLSNNNTAAFGSSVVVDGVPISNNGQMAQGDFSATSFAGSDLRQMSADDIDEVEVIRGIPSAEYGDLTSGMVVVHSKIGVTPWQVKGKVN
ncbi:MAG: TonB-dependent receptor, partial [Prevotella sp.]|nr:TonB-dependent receptor [Prevotella sp.]